MPPDINSLLEECREKTTALVEEIEQYRRSRELNQMATESLEKMATSLQETMRQLAPFTDLKMRRFQLFVFVASIANSVLLLAMIILLIVKTL
jgi:predicted nuclease with TOPRIM domain